MLTKLIRPVLFAFVFYSRPRTEYSSKANHPYRAHKFLINCFVDAQNIAID